MWSNHSTIWRISLGFSSIRIPICKGDAAHSLHFSPGAPSIQNENGPQGGAVPKGPRFILPVRVGIPAPRFSRRAIPINRARHYRPGTNGVKAILLLNGGARGSGVGDHRARTEGERLTEIVRMQPNTSQVRVP